MLVCKHCGSSNVGQDAWVDPNTNTIHSVYQGAHCFDCDGETTLIEGFGPLIDVARTVVIRWAGGDLAGAVRQLNIELAKIGQDVK